jgi:quercetin dioxygenase-like cupin family protein
MKYRAGSLFLFLFCTLTFSCKNNTTSTKPPTDHTTTIIHRTAEEGTEWIVLGSEITGKILSEDTNGEYAVIITKTPPNGGPPKHLHTHEDELFFVLQGSYEFRFGDTIVKAKQGDMVHLPKGTPHSFKNIDTLMGITMNTITPGGFETFFADISSLSKQNLLHKKQMDSLANKYGIRFMEAK